MVGRDLTLDRLPHVVVVEEIKHELRATVVNFALAIESLSSARSFSSTVIATAGS